MASAWPEPVERVSSFLRASGVESRIQEFPEGTPTAEAAAEAAGCELEQIVKSLVLVCDERPVVALVPGDRRCDPDKVARALEATSARVAKAQEVEDATGFPPGAVAPFPLPKVETVLMDPALYRHSLVCGRAPGRIAHARHRARRARAARPRQADGRRAGSNLGYFENRRRADAMQATEKIWMNGELVDWDDAKIHVASHGLNYGSGVFEGMRCYDTPRGPSVFRLTDHLRALDDSARSIYMDLPFTVEELTLRRPRPRRDERDGSCYLRPLAFYGYGELGVSSVGNPVDVVVISFPWGAYLGEESQTAGITTKISSWERVGPTSSRTSRRRPGMYLNSMLATMEARRGGYDEAIMLSHDGYIADGPGENIFVVRTACCTRRRSRCRSSPGSRATRSSRSPRISAIASRRRCSSAPTSTSPTRCSWSGPRPRSRRCERWTIARSASAR